MRANWLRRLLGAAGRALARWLQRRAAQLEGQSARLAAGPAVISRQAGGAAALERQTGGQLGDEQRDEPRPADELQAGAGQPPADWLARAGGSAPPAHWLETIAGRVERWLAAGPPPPPAPAAPAQPGPAAPYPATSQPALTSAPAVSRIALTGLPTSPGSDDRPEPAGETRPTAGLPFAGERLSSGEPTRAEPSLRSSPQGAAMPPPLQATPSQPAPAYPAGLPAAPPPLAATFSRPAAPGRQPADRPRAARFRIRPTVGDLPPNPDEALPGEIVSRPASINPAVSRLPSAASPAAGQQPPPLPASQALQPAYPLRLQPRPISANQPQPPAENSPARPTAAPPQAPLPSAFSPFLQAIPTQPAPSRTARQVQDSGFPALVHTQLPATALIPALQPAPGREPESRPPPAAPPRFATNSSSAAANPNLGASPPQPWPDLPIQDFDSGELPGGPEALAAQLRAERRAQRLDLEQRGYLWSESPF
jgi:hypothetical protein